MSTNEIQPDMNSGADLFASGIFWLERKDYAAALDALMLCHRLDYKKDEIEKLILEDYYHLFCQEHKQNYIKNVELFSSYAYIYQSDYPDFDELRYQFIPCMSSRYMIYDREKSIFISNFDLKQRINLDACKENSLVMIKNEFRLENILACAEKTRESQPFLWKKTPQYLFYSDFDEFVQYMQILDWTPALQLERLVFLFGREELEQYFSDSQALFPEWILNVWDKNDEVVQFFNLQHSLNVKRITVLKGAIQSYYTTLSRQDLLARIQAGKPRFLFVTSRFTTALQYFTRDCALACDKLGIPNKFLIENSNLHRISPNNWYEILNDFQPDIIFCIDHFRWESPFLPDNVLFLSWIQDILPHIASRESAARIGPLDFILNAFISNIDFLLDFGYPRQAIIEAPVVTNPSIYKTYSLSPAEQEMYGADICAYSNAGNPQKGLDNFLTHISASPQYEQIKPIFTKAYRDMYEAYYQEDILYSLQDYQKFLAYHLEANGLSIGEADLLRLAGDWRQEVGYRILRSVPLEWLHEEGYDLKIWGSEWTEHPLLATHAQGVAANGETLSRIINACKIVIGTNPGMTTHPRVGESILSNRFYLSYSIPVEHDWANIRRYLKENAEIIFAYNRQDLFKKVDYYLQNQPERHKVCSKARLKIMEHLSYEALITKIIRELAHKLGD